MQDEEVIVSVSTQGTVGMFHLRVAVHDEEGAVQVPLDPLPAYNVVAAAELLFNISVRHVVVLAGTEGAGIDLVEFFPFIPQLPVDDGKEHGRGTVLQGPAEALLPVKASLTVDGSLFLPALQGGIGHLFCVYFIPKGEYLVGKCLMVVFPAGDLPALQGPFLHGEEPVGPALLPAALLPFDGPVRVVPVGVHGPAGAVHGLLDALYLFRAVFYAFCKGCQDALLF